MAKIPDPFALLRTRDKLTLSEASKVACDVPYSRIYPGNRADYTQELRDEKGRVTATLQEMVRDANAGALRVHKVETRTGGGRRTVSFVRSGDFESQFEPVRTTVDWERSTVGIDEFKNWCGLKGLRPEFFCAVEDSAAGKSLSTTERETLLGLIAVLAEAAGLDLRMDTKGHAEGKAISGWASRRKMKITPETVAKKIVEGRTLILPAGPERDSN